jgi:TldD protein
MSNLATTDDLFFNRAGLDRTRMERLVDDALGGADDGELFLEYRQSEGLSFDDGVLKSASFDTAQGFGLRAIVGEAAGYAHSSELNEAAVGRAGEAVKAVKTGRGGVMSEAPAGTNQRLYTDENPLGLVPFETKVALLSDIDAYARAKDPRVCQVMATLAGEWQAVQILRAGGERSGDIRPLVRLNVSVVVGDGDRMESGGYGGGGRISYAGLIEPDYWQAAVDEALRQAVVNLDSVDAPVARTAAHRFRCRSGVAGDHGGRIVLDW